LRAIARATADLGQFNNRVNTVFTCVIKTPMQRLSQPEKVANAILFLASDEASYITEPSWLLTALFSALILSFHKKCPTRLFRNGGIAI